MLDRPRLLALIVAVPLAVALTGGLAGAEVGPEDPEAECDPIEDGTPPGPGDGADPTDESPEPGADDLLDDGPGSEPSNEPEGEGEGEGEPPVVVRDGLGSHDPAVYGPFRLKSGLVLPYPLDNVFRGFAECRRRGHRHRALDIGGVGPAWGVGTPVWSMARAKVVAVGTPEDDPARFGQRVTRKDKVFRGRRWLPTSAVLPDYGMVWFFTSNYGKSRTGVYVTTKILEGRFRNYTVTYMHLAALHPKVRLGEVVEAGQELGLMGGTAVLEAAPHVHIGMRTPGDVAVDLGPLFGIGPTRASCKAGRRGERSLRAQYSRAADRLMATLRREALRTVQAEQAPTTCGTWSAEGEFGAGGRERTLRHRYPVPRVVATGAGATIVEVERLSGRWQPKLTLEDSSGNDVWTGARASRADQRRYGITPLVNGRRGSLARVGLAPPDERSLSAVISAWGGRAPPRGARYRLTVTRPCPGPPPPGPPWR